MSQKNVLDFSQKLNNKLLKRKRIQDALDYVDSYNTHKRYETISNKRTYLREHISVDLLSWQMTKMQRKPFLFFNDVLVYIWPPNILKNRCLDKSRTRYKSSSGTIKVLIVSPRKLSLALSLYNDYLSELKMKDDIRFKCLNDSFKIICTKIRDVRIKYKDQSEKEMANERRIETSN